MNNNVISQKARQIARDEAQERDLEDAEWECLHDLLKSDEAFGHLVTAHWSAVAAADAIDNEVAYLATSGAEDLADARENVIEQRVEQAKEIVELAATIDEEAPPWGIMIQVYRRGFTTPEELDEVGLHELIAETGIHPQVAETIKHGQPASRTVQEDSTDG